MISLGGKLFNLFARSNGYAEFCEEHQKLVPKSSKLYRKIKNAKVAAIELAKYLNSRDPELLEIDSFTSYFAKKDE